MKNKRGYLQISFAWLFAIIVGGIILFLAIFLSTKLIRTEQTSISAQTGKEIGVLLNPLETGFEVWKTTSLSLPTETRIYNKCNNNGIFGRQIIQISQKSFDKWTETDIDIGFSNKYIFSEEYVEGKNFYIFSKPFEFPFKVSDLIYITSASEKYCFIDAPSHIKEEISVLNQKNLFAEDCSDSESIKICFQGENCEINIDSYSQYVEKDGKRLYFEGDALMYAAVFSEPDVYECQVKRLMQRVKNLALLYKDKANFISQKSDCQSNLDLLKLSNFADALESSKDLSSVSFIVDEVKEQNKGVCKLW
ncbi:hypothetical protein KAR52_00790 [Candidatus Pacearchaeota archaeon]|nr:hypothetical protein [Candidatus Pacearchaeota archaeon]